MQWISFLSYIFAITISPGPNTLIALSSGNRFSVKQTAILFAGMYTGFYIVMIICALFITNLQKYIPTAVPYLKWLGVAFLVYLAWHIAKAGNLDENKAKKYEEGYGFWRGFLLQFMNVKIYLGGMTAMQSYLLEYFSIPICALLITLAGFLSAIVWAIAGKTLSLVFSKHGVLINRILAILLLVVAFNMARM